MKIAIVGTGFSGLATGWFLLKKSTHKKPLKITFFDPEGIGGGASGMAAGLMHPYAGASAKLNRKGVEGYLATCKLLDLASEKMGMTLSNRQGLLRLAVTDRQRNEYRLAAEKYDDITWWEAEVVIQKFPGLSSHPGIFIESSVTVDCPLYLQGLWKACEERGARLVKSRVNALDDLKDFDQIVLALGFSTNRLLDVPLPIAEVKGQVIELAWPKTLEPLPFALNSQAYLLMNNEKKSCFVGATYERDFESVLPDISYASKDILPKALVLIPALQGASIQGCKAGVRASTPDHMPIIQNVNSKCWVITGMGSKGLLYHALYAEKLADLIISDSAYFL